ncbi:SecDF P1 head subdomain-containing protein [Jannaschia aquimarina]|uniref:SecD_2 protein n=1 Tax=Jannaschia aquimarina TaxID=935700 RepID=A0A0D1ED48_9RHOB|nr:hypothetical protein [Jannaschia aquimarina]KIT14836.1 Protein translocase subunit SecD [Jannaschia aquimarina]SNS57223.1 hypothetical protein SAMN05421775_101486 [Jannaschia aquimarina]
MRAPLAGLALLAGAAQAGEAFVLSAGPEEAVFTGAEVADAVIAQGQQGGPVVFVTLSENGARRLAAFTTPLVGEVVELSRCGEVLVAPRLMTPIYSGNIQIPAPVDPGSAEALAAAIREGTECPGG